MAFRTRTWIGTQAVLDFRDQAVDLVRVGHVGGEGLGRGPARRDGCRDIGRTLGVRAVDRDGESFRRQSIGNAAAEPSRAAGDERDPRMVIHAASIAPLGANPGRSVMLVPTGTARRKGVKYRIEVVTMPVTDVDRAKAFYQQAGWNLDVDTEPAPGFRVVQFTPSGSEASITFGTGMPQSEPGSYVNTYLVVSDIEQAHRELKERGIDVSDIYHWSETGPDAGRRPQSRGLRLLRQLRRSRRQHLARPGGSQPRIQRLARVQARGLPQEVPLLRQAGGA